MPKVLTEAQLAEVDRIIEDTDVVTSSYSDDDGGSIEVDNAGGTLREAARRVRAYLATL